MALPNVTVRKLGITQSASAAMGRVLILGWREEMENESQKAQSVETPKVMSFTDICAFGLHQIRPLKRLYSWSGLGKKWLLMGFWVLISIQAGKIVGGLQGLSREVAVEFTKIPDTKGHHGLQSTKYFIEAVKQQLERLVPSLYPDTGGW